MAVHEFFVLNRSDRELLLQKVRSACDAWQREWRAGGPVAAEACLLEDAPRTAPIEAGWQIGRLDAGPIVAVSASAAGLLATLIGQIPEAEADSDGTGEAARELGVAALQALGAALAVGGIGAQALHWSGDSPGKEIGQAHEGFVAAAVRIGIMEVRVVLYPRLTSGYLGRARADKRRRGGLVRARSAAISQKVMLDICAGQAELTLPELATLSVGDVIALDRRLDEPMHVRMAEGPLVCAAHLGTRERHKAVQFTSLTERREA